MLYGGFEMFFDMQDLNSKKQGEKGGMRDWAAPTEYDFLDHKSI